MLREASILPIWTDKEPLNSFWLVTHTDIKVLTISLGDRALISRLSKVGLDRWRWDDITEGIFVNNLESIGTATAQLQWQIKSTAMLFLNGAVEVSISETQKLVNLLWCKTLHIWATLTIRNESSRRKWFRLYSLNYTLCFHTFCGQWKCVVKPQDLLAIWNQLLEGRSSESPEKVLKMVSGI